MRFARFIQQGRSSYAIAGDDTITPIDGTPFGTWQPSGSPIPLGQARLDVPVVPANFYAIGLNYAGHVQERARLGGAAAQLPTRPEPGYRSVNALVAHGQPIVLPADTTTVQYEGELVVVIGRRAKHVRESEALQCVLGYTIGNDISERNWQKIDRSFWRCKNSDTFKPMGPWIETEVDLDALRTSVRVNGRTQIEFATNDMIFGVARCIAAITEYITLHPGDVIWMGTEGASTDLHPGDVVEVEISSIGTLRNPVVAGTSQRGSSVADHATQ
ncbi:MAG: fumarylacetoacetate hydrolase family protein [Gammaproteobacteria bacterium]|nr:fumarylacetoacetate hydrolase family protein [Gammaproteobacteria bacterium]MDE2250174.1 fumarylacetoacetate hydrolase family protein [Gammaproteobacteria bacterium]